MGDSVVVSVVVSAVVVSIAVVSAAVVSAGVLVSVLAVVSSGGVSAQPQSMRAHRMGSNSFFMVCLLSWVILIISIISYFSQYFVNRM